MSDPTEKVRREMVAVINSNPKTRSELEDYFGIDKVWDTDELTTEFDVLSFMAPFCIVKRKRDGTTGSVMFQHYPRLYFDFCESERCKA